MSLNAKTVQVWKATSKEETKGDGRKGRCRGGYISSHSKSGATIPSLLIAVLDDADALLLVVPPSSLSYKALQCRISIACPRSYIARRAKDTTDIDLKY
jgi:hypothetical protein